MKQHKIGIILNGVTGRMGTNQHLLRSICPIMKQGGIRISDNEVIMPDPILVGRNPEKLRALTEQSGVTKTTTNVDEALADPNNVIYFDAQTTGRRAEAVRKAVACGKHCYLEKPVAVDVKTAMELHELCVKAGLKSGVVQDKISSVASRMSARCLGATPALFTRQCNPP